MPEHLTRIKRKERKRYDIYTAVEKACLILNYLKKYYPHAFRNITLSRHFGFHKATTNRTLHTLKAYGLIGQDKEKRYYYFP